MFVQESSLWKATEIDLTPGSKERPWCKEGKKVIKKRNEAARWKDTDAAKGGLTERSGAVGGNNTWGAKHREKTGESGQQQ